MGTRALRALISTLLIAGVFSTPFLTSYSFAEEVATSTAGTLVEMVPEVVTEPEATTTEPDSPTATKNAEESAPATFTSDPEPVPTIAQHSLPGPEFMPAGLRYPMQANVDGNGQFQKALKDGDSVYADAVMYHPFVTTSVTADLSQLGGGANVPLVGGDSYYSIYNGPYLFRHFQGEFFKVATGGASGTRTITFNAVDEHGTVSSTVLNVVLDQTPPTLTLSEPVRVATSTLKQFDTLLFSGTFDGTGSNPRLYNIRAQEMAVDGTTVLRESYYNSGHPASPEFLALSAGAFTAVPIRLYIAEGNVTYPANTISLRYVFDVRDDAGNLFSATSSLISVAPPSEPVGPQVSNVLFLPGIKGSRLYSDENRCGVIGCDNKLWDPASSVDVQDLYLTPDGKSSRSDIYAKEGDIVDEISILGTPIKKKFYASFIEDMNELQASTTYNGGDFEWKAAAYDWRLSLDDIINNGVERDGKIYYEEASSTPYIEQTLRELAATSTTGKVTIIAHSNGGLVTKALLAKLGDAETARLIDKIIFVGVPQTGAPQALGGLLFGDREGLPLDLLPAIATPAVARGLAEYSPMAYHLMPSNRYLSDTQDPSHSIIGFSGSVLYGNERSAYGSSIDTITELDDFLLARDGGRTKPETSDAKSANVLSSSLITYANTTHDSLDSWVPPASVTLYQIAGWGANTISGIDFYDEKKILGINTGYKRQYRPIFVEDGDGVVPVPSALTLSAASNVENYWVDLQKARIGLTKYDHGNLFELKKLNDFVFNILTGGSLDTSDETVRASQPGPTPNGSRLIFQLHSPLTLGLYDASGNFTGLNPDGSVSENIPGAEYGEFGDVKYLIAPAGSPYQLVMLGQSAGTFSLDIQEQTGNTITSSATIADVPTTASTIAKLTITNGVADASSLAVDTDGNGTTDTTVSAQVGGTVNYVPATPPTIEPSASYSRKPSSIVVSKNMVASVDSLPAIALFPARVTYTAPVPPKGVVAGAFVESTQVVKTASIETPPGSTQTASVFYAFSSVAHWLKMSLYNVWAAILHTLNFLGD